MRCLGLALLLVCSAVFGQGSFGVVPNVGLLINNADYSCSQCRTGLSGTLLIRGFATGNGYLAFNNGGNSLTSVEAPDVTTMTAGLWLDGNQITTLNFPRLTVGAFSAKANPVASVHLPELQQTSCKHVYIGGATSTITRADFPKLTHMLGALSFTGSPLLQTVTLPVLAQMDHELEFDGTSALTTVDLPALTTISGRIAGLNLCNGAQVPGLLFGGSNIATINVPLLATINGSILAPHNQLTDFALPSLTTLGQDASVDLSHNKLSVAAVNALLVKLDAAKGSNTCTVSLPQFPCIDLRYQTPPAAPTGAGLAAKNSLNAAGFTTQTD